MATLRRLSQYLTDVRNIVGTGTTAFLALGNTQRVGKLNGAVLSVTTECGSPVYDVAYSESLVYAAQGREVAVFDTDLALQETLSFSTDVKWLAVSSLYLFVPEADGVRVFDRNLVEVAQVQVDPHVTGYAVLSSTKLVLFYVEQESVSIEIQRRRIDGAWQYDTTSARHYKLDSAPRKWSTVHPEAQAFNASRVVVDSSALDAWLQANMMLPSSTEEAAGLPNSGSYLSEGVSIEDETTGWMQTSNPPTWDTDFVTENDFIFTNTGMAWVDKSNFGEGHKLYLDIPNAGYTRVRIPSTGWGQIGISVRTDGFGNAYVPKASVVWRFEFLDAAGVVKSWHDIIYLNGVECEQYQTEGTPNIYFDRRLYNGTTKQEYFARYCSTATAGLFSPAASVPPGTATIRVSLDSPSTGEAGERSISTVLEGAFTPIYLEQGGAEDAWLGYEDGAWLDGTEVDYTNFADGEATNDLAAKDRTTEKWYDEDEAAQVSSIFQVKAPVRKALYIDPVGYAYKPVVTRNEYPRASLAANDGTTVYLYRSNKLYTYVDGTLTDTVVQTFDPASLFVTDEGAELGRVGPGYTRIGYGNASMTVRVLSAGRYTVETP